MAINIRDERSGDGLRIEGVQRAAFDGDAEAEIVAALRSSGAPLLSLVAEVNGVVRGHAMFSPVRLDPPGAELRVCGLGPVAVEPDYQRRGIGSALIYLGLSRCAGFGWSVVFVLGDPKYYSRFGFELAAPRGFHYASHEFDSAFQLLELEQGALPSTGGWVAYHESFAAAD